MHARTHAYTTLSSAGRQSWCVGWNATLIRYNDMTGMAMLSHQVRKDGGMMEQETDRETQRERENEGGSKGRKEETPRTWADTEETKGRKWMRACQLMSALKHPSPISTPSKIRGIPFCFSCSCFRIIFFFSSGGWYWGVWHKDMLFTWCDTHTPAKNSCSPAQPDEWHYKRTHTSKRVSVTSCSRWLIRPLLSCTISHIFKISWKSWRSGNTDTRAHSHKIAKSLSQSMCDPLKRNNEGFPLQNVACNHGRARYSQWNQKRVGGVGFWFSQNTL